MGFKLIPFTCLLALVNAGIQGTSTWIDKNNQYDQNNLPIDVNHHFQSVEKHTTTPTVVIDRPEDSVTNKPVNYQYQYSVYDPHTGDIKAHNEEREGHQVRGSYSLIEADGSKRIVDYTADAHHGFNAFVRREPLAHPVTVTPQKGHGPDNNLENFDEAEDYYHHY